MADHLGDPGLVTVESDGCPVKIRAAITMAVAILSGLVVLARYFVPLEVLVASSDTLIQWAILLTAFAVLVGIINLLTVHFTKIARKQKGAFYSLVLIIGMVITFALGILSPYFEKLSSAFRFTFQAIQFPVEASLMALLVVTMTYGSIRLLRHRLSAFSIILLVTALLVLLGMAPLPFIGTIPLLSDTLRPFIAQVLAGSGARGILIGVALGALTTGLRVLLGVDRPYEAK
jgi:NAD/NADP transhydrogenase beta subunit